MSRAVYDSREWRDEIRLEVIARDGHRCSHCHRHAHELTRGTADLHVDHIRALHDGGTNEHRNLRTLCRDCHARKTAADRAARARRTPQRGMRAARPCQPLPNVGRRGGRVET